MAGAAIQWLRNEDEWRRFLSELTQMISERFHAQHNDMFLQIECSISKFRNINDEKRARAIAANSNYAKIVCRCETIAEAEIRKAIRRPVGVRTVDGIKRRTRKGMGRCRAGFCL